jgi:pimeloyl-ACP methyl ester carboxylesterase
MPHIDRDGVSVYYAAHGQGSPVLLSHGYGATTAMWEGQLGPLGGSHRIITWDMRGHGETDSPDDQDQYTEDASVDDMAAVLDAEGVDKAVIGGLSLGGYFSLAFYVKYPERVQALMLFDTGPGYNNPKAREEWNQTAFKRAEQFEEQGLDALGRGAEVAISRHRSADGQAKAARGMLAQFNANVIQSLDSIAVPVLVLVGAKDRAFLAATDYMEAKIPNATKVVIEDAGHAANIHQPEAFNRATGEFLDSL